MCDALSEVSADVADSRDFPLVARAGKPGFEGILDAREVRVGSVVFGGADPVVIAGPCAVESREQTLAIARAVRDAGADCLRGGAYKPRTSPYSFQGLGVRGLEILAEARAETDLPIVTEVMDVRLLDTVAGVADVLQVGSRSMQNFPLLVEIGRCGKPVLLKRGMSATMKEWLCAAEYIALHGNEDVILCERGMRCSTSREYARSTLDTGVLVPVREASVLPVIADPSHASGRPDQVPWAARAAIGAGAQGLIIEVIDEETDRAGVRCDGAQAIRPSALRRIIREVKGASALAV